MLHASKQASFEQEEQNRASDHLANLRLGNDAFLFQGTYGKTGLSSVFVKIHHLNRTIANF